MIIINEKKYNKYSVEVNSGKFNVKSFSNGKSITRTGEAFFITFAITPLIAVGIETTYSKEDLEKIQINDRIDITKYISDILYADEKGWVSLNQGNYTCNIKRTDKSNYIIKLEVNDKMEELKITVDSIVKLN